MGESFAPGKAARPLTGATRVAGVIGMPVRHSISPAIHNAAFAATGLDWAFVAFEVEPTELPAAIDGVRALGLAGLSVTMPHKEATAGLVDRCSDDATLLGAVNCVRREGSTLIGENTDGPGFVDALRDDHGFDPAGRSCAVIGAGGAARAVVLALARASAGEIAVVNRTPERGAAAAALAPATGRTDTPGCVARADLVVNATPVGMVDDALPVDPALLRPGQVVVDLIYHPAETPLLAAARARGAVAVNGLGMLVHQAAHAFRLWTGLEPPIPVMAEAVRHALAEGH